MLAAGVFFGNLDHIFYPVGPTLQIVKDGFPVGEERRVDTC